MLRLAIVAVLSSSVTLIQAADQQEPNSAVSVDLMTDEAEAVLGILAKRNSQLPLTEADWSRLLTSEGYVRLKAREASMKRSFEDEAFKSFVLSQELGLQTALLRQTLDRWSTVDMQTLAKRTLSYLPDRARIRAKVYPVIKPATNSFVFDLAGDPAIFLYLDPKVGEDKFRNTVIHELHHIGFGGSCPSKEAASEIERLPPESRTALTWMGAFGEGFAMLAAAGGPEVHPHAVSDAAERATWDRNVARLAADQSKLESFFNSVLEKRLEGDAVSKAGFEFFGEQGPWYTLGWQMAVTIERILGRPRLVEAFCDSRKLFASYNEALAAQPSSPAPLPAWSVTLVNKLAGSNPR
jgi:hypothetical protein